MKALVCAELLTACTACHYRMAAYWCADTLRQSGQDDELAWRKEGDTWDLAEEAEDDEGDEEGEGDDTVTTAQLRELVEDRWVKEGGRVRGNIAARELWMEA